MRSPFSIIFSKACASSLLIALALAFVCRTTCCASQLDVAAPPPEKPEPVVEPKYAPDRKVDIEHLALDVTPDFEKRTVAGVATFTFKPIAKPLDELKLDAVDLTVEDVKCTAELAGYQATDKEITVTFAKPIPVDVQTKLTIRYAAQPTKGLYFRVPSNGYDAADTHLFSQGEMIEGRHWFPSYDYPNEKFTSEITCHVPEGMQVFSNGRQISSDKDPVSKLVAVHWSQEKPHVNYLLSLVAGYFSKTTDTYRDIPLFYATTASDTPEAALTFKNTKPIMEFFEKEIDFPYPWAQYGQVVVRDFSETGMENTSVTTLSDNVLQRPETEDISRNGTTYTNEEVIAHEMAHQWFGDLVTCKDWSQSWLNEGFATYYALLYIEHQHGHDEMVYGLYKNLNNLVHRNEEYHEYHMPAETRPIIFRAYTAPIEQFDQRAYTKGSWVLHMLRTELGADLFRKCIKTYLDRHKYQNVVTADLNNIVEEFSGRSFDRFFDQWFYRSGYPELDVQYSWDEKRKLAKVSVAQKQEGSDQTKLYHLPLLLRFKSKSGSTDHTVDVKNRSEDFYVPLPVAPQIVRVDPDLTLLAKIEFPAPSAMLYAQLTDNEDTAGRLLAADQLAEKKDDRTIAALKVALNKDKFYGVRVRAAEALRTIHSDTALDALIASVSQSNACARDSVIGNIGKFYNSKSKEALLHSLVSEKNPIIVAAALAGLAPYHEPNVEQIFLKYLVSESYHNRLADAAIAAMRAQDDPKYIAEIRNALKAHEKAFTTVGFASGLEALGYLSRNEKEKDGQREFLAGFLNDKRENIQIGAIRALGSLEDRKAASLLQTFANSLKDSRQQQEAEWALNNIRYNNKPHDNLKILHDEVSDLQKSNRELKKDLEDLRKLVEAGQAGQKQKQSTQSKSH